MFPNIRFHIFCVSLIGNFNLYNHRIVRMWVTSLFHFVRQNQTICLPYEMSKKIFLTKHKINSIVYFLTMKLERLWLWYNFRFPAWRPCSSSILQRICWDSDSNLNVTVHNRIKNKNTTAICRKRQNRYNIHTNTWPLFLTWYKYFTHQIHDHSQSWLGRHFNNNWWS